MTTVIWNPEPAPDDCPDCHIPQCRTAGNCPRLEGRIDAGAWLPPRPQDWPGQAAEYLAGYDQRVLERRHRFRFAA